MKKFFYLFSIVLLSASTAVAQYPSSMYLIGSATSSGWSLDAAPLMVTQSDGVYEWVGDLNEGELKFLTQRDWMPSYGPATNGASLTLGTLELTKREQELVDNDNKYMVAAGRYSFRIDLTGGKPQLIVADGTGLNDKGFTIEYPRAVYAIGDATPGGWSLDDAVEMKETSFNSGIYKGKVTLKNGELKFLHQRDWGVAYGATVANDPVSGEGDYNIGKTDDGNDLKFKLSLTNATEFDITVDAVAGKMTIKLSGSTAIDQLSLNNETVILYDLQGRRMNSEMLPAGVYIQQTTSGSQKIVIR